MKFTAFPILKTERLQLIEVTEAHIAPMMDTIKYNIGNPTPEQAIETIQRSKNYLETGTGITWGLEYKGELIGSVGFYRGFENNKGEIGYVMRQRFRRKGFMREAISAILQFGFDTMKLDRIEAHTSEENTPSVALLLNLGFTNTGILKNQVTVFERLP